MGKALYRKYRSKSLDEIVGQSHVVDLLQRSLTNGTVGHAYLLTGIRGTGKTSIARILAHEINGLTYDSNTTHLDIIEIDAASNSSVEDIRELKDKSMIAPVMAPKKVYIIDEVHMLSKSAFNALLKTLEEPPEHVVFILATTDVDKLPSTILSRVQRFNLRPISSTDIVKHLAYIAKEESIAIDPEALELLATHAGGSFRDAISLLDQVRGLDNGQISQQHIEQSLGLMGSAEIDELFSLYHKGDDSGIIHKITELEARGLPMTSLIDQLLYEGKRRVNSNPSLIHLLDKLVDAKKSDWPDVKLLAALVQENHSAGPTRTSTVTPPKTVKTIAQPKQINSPASTPQSSQLDKQPSVSSQPKPSKPEQGTSQPAKPLPKNVDFSWQSFHDHMKEANMGAYSVLARCGHDFDGTTLRIFCGKPFPKKQLEKVLPALSDSLQKSGIQNGTIQLLAEPKPPEDSNVAAAIAIMGGGEEVNLNG